MMEYSVNTRPLLQHSDSDTDFEEQDGHEIYSTNDNPVVITKDTSPLFKVQEPKDRYNLAYIIFYLLGMTTLLPWYFFVTAYDYWMYKLRDVSGNNTFVDDDSHSELQTSFTAYLSVASTIPNTLFLILNSLLSHKISLRFRMVGSLSTIIILFIMTTALVKIDTDSWQQIFFIVTLLTVVLLNIASAILQGGLFGLVGKFSARYITAVVSGQALGGIFAALASILSLCLGASATTSAFVYFMVANAMLLLALTAYLILSRAMFFRYHLLDKNEVDNIQYEPGIIEGSSFEPPVRNVSYMSILSKMWTYGLTEWLTFFITLAMYPSVTVLVCSADRGNKAAWNDVYFVPVVGYLFFSVFDYAGRMLAGLLKWPQGRGWLLLLFSACRTVFVPLILFCNAQPRHHLPVLIHSDAYYIIIMVVFALSNGYLASISLICVPRVVDTTEQETASSMMAAFLGVGLACGSALGLGMVKIL